MKAQKNDLEKLVAATINGVIAGESILIISARSLAGVTRQYMIQPVGGRLMIEVISDETKTK